MFTFEFSFQLFRIRHVSTAEPHLLSSHAILIFSLHLLHGNHDTEVGAQRSIVSYLVDPNPVSSYPATTHASPRERLPDEAKKLHPSLPSSNHVVSFLFSFSSSCSFMQLL
jgi:hypothetical protein